MTRLSARVFVAACLIISSLLLLSIRPYASATPLPDARETLIAIGDVHGDVNDFSAILQHVGLMDDQRHWTGGKVTFVQNGDLLDRGPKPRDVLDLMMTLEDQAPKAGGRVVALLGNHEVMNIMGDLRYVTPEDFANFADSDSEKRRTAAYKEYAAWCNGHKQALVELPQPVMPLTEEEWMKRHPLGYFEYRDAFSPKGIYGKWLRQHSAVAKIGDVIFLHGGLSPNVVSMKLDDINKRIHNEIHDFDETRQYLVDQRIILPFFGLQEAVAAAQAELTAERKSLVPSDQMRQANILRFLEFGSWLCVREDGPLWFRGYDRWSDEEGAPQVEKILAAYSAANIVVGHTVQRTAQIRPRFGGKVMLIDTGMLSSYYPGGKPSALEIQDDGKFTAVYLDQQVVLLEAKSAQPALK